MNSFDRIAPVYDLLAGIVFGKAIQEAQKAHLDELGAAREILIVGGGTGWLLKELLQRNPFATFVYLEASARMIAMAEHGLLDADRPRVTFIHGRAEDLQGTGRFDAVVVNFFVDVFARPELTEILDRLRLVLRPDGRLLCTDFVDDVWWHSALLSAMYTFFKFATGLQNNQLAPWQRMIPTAGFEKLRAGSFYKGFICSELYRKR